MKAIIIIIIIPMVTVTIHNHIKDNRKIKSILNLK
jgi:hypothetical protein